MTFHDAIQAIDMNFTLQFYYEKMTHFTYALSPLGPHYNTQLIIRLHKFRYVQVWCKQRRGRGDGEEQGRERYKQ